MKTQDTSPEIELIVRVTDGSFESKLSISVESTEEQRNQFAKMWVSAMAFAFSQQLKPVDS